MEYAYIYLVDTSNVDKRNTNNYDSDDIDLYDLLTLLPDDVQARLRRLVHANDRRMGIVSQTLQRHVFVKLYADNCQSFKISDIVIKRSRWGRPYWGLDEMEINTNSRCEYDYNVSHHDGLVVLAVRKSNSIGVDIALETDFTGEDFKYVFSNSEIRSVEGGSTTYSQLWSLKESYLKAIGSGLSDDIGSIEFTDVDSRNVVECTSTGPFEVDFAQHRYPKLLGLNTATKFLSIDLNNGRILSLCMPGAEKVVFYYRYLGLKDFLTDVDLILNKGAFS